MVDPITKGFRIYRKSPGRAAINRSISADPNMNDPEIQAKIGNRMTKTVEKSIGTLRKLMMNELQFRYLILT